MRVKRTYHAGSKNTEWAAQRDPADPQETKTILKKKEKMIPDEPLDYVASSSRGSSSIFFSFFLRMILFYQWSAGSVCAVHSAFSGSAWYVLFTLI